MEIKRIIISIVLLSLLFSSVQAQEIRSDSIVNNTERQNGQADSLQVLYDELNTLKSRVGANEKEEQIKKIWKRKKYLKIGLVNPHLECTDSEPLSWKTEFSIFTQTGKTAYFHSKPVAGIFKFGIDYGMDISYSKLKLDVSESATTSVSMPSNQNPNGFDNIVSKDPSGSVFDIMGINLGMHKVEYALHVGPSISINPWNHIIVAAYFHAMPTASGIIENSAFSYGFCCAMSAGVSVSYKLISVGIEGMWGKIKYKQTSFDDEDENDESEWNGDANLFNTKTFRMKQNGPRFYVAFRF